MTFVTTSATNIAIDVIRTFNADALENETPQISLTINSRDVISFRDYDGRVNVVTCYRNVAGNVRFDAVIYDAQGYIHNEKFYSASNFAEYVIWHGYRA